MSWRRRWRRASHGWMGMAGMGVVDPPSHGFGAAIASRSEVDGHGLTRTGTDGHGLGRARSQSCQAVLSSSRSWGHWLARVDSGMVMTVLCWSSGFGVVKSSLAILRSSDSLSSCLVWLSSFPSRTRSLVSPFSWRFLSCWHSTLRSVMRSQTWTGFSEFRRWMRLTICSPLSAAHE